jgi:hypothetical protein
MSDIDWTEYSTEDATYFRIQVYCDRSASQTAGKRWVDSGEYPLINKAGVLDTGLEVWRAYVAYLNLAREDPYRLVRYARTVTKEIL